MIKETFGIIILAILLLTVIGLQFDDELLPEVKALQDKVQTLTPTSSQSYWYLLGFLVSPQDDPISVGKTLYQSIQKGEENYFKNNETFTYQNYPQVKQIILPGGDLFCTFSRQDCLNFLFQSIEPLKLILDNNALLMTRYDEFNHYDDYATLSKPQLSEPIPDLQPIIKANRLLLLKSILLTKQANMNEAMLLLNDNRTRLRRQLVSQDTLIGKMVYLFLLSDNIDLSFVLSRKMKGVTIETIKFLSPGEKNLEVVMAREFSMGHTMFNLLEGSPDFFDKGGDTPEWYVNLVYKANMSINELYLKFAQVIENSKLSSHEFSQLMHQKKLKNKDEPKINISRLRNYAGTVLNQISASDYNKYVARFFDLDAKILLFNSLLGQSRIKQMSNAISNPYYPEKHFAALSYDEPTICFKEGPFPDDRHLRCLVIDY